MNAITWVRSLGANALPLPSIAQLPEAHLEQSCHGIYSSLDHILRISCRRTAKVHKLEIAMHNWECSDSPGLCHHDHVHKGLFRHHSVTLAGHDSRLPGSGAINFPTGFQLVLSEVIHLLNGFQIPFLALGWRWLWEKLRPRPVPIVRPSACILSSWLHCCPFLQESWAELPSSSGTRLLAARRSRALHISSLALRAALVGCLLSCLMLDWQHGGCRGWISEQVQHSLQEASKRCGSFLSWSGPLQRTQEVRRASNLSTHEEKGHDYNRDHGSTASFT